MKLIAATLASLIVLIQYPLWLGKGGWLRVWELDRQLLAKQGGNDRLAQRNAGLEAEVQDLQTGLFAVEERARYELGMVRPDEYFVNYQPASAVKPGPVAPQSPPARNEPTRARPLSASYSVQGR
ncbi:MAG: cell division protein FtsB [Quisquiliibacterium sp.]